MATFKPMRGDSGRLNSQPVHDGRMWYTTDDGKLYIDHGDVRRLINPDAIKVGSRAKWDANPELIGEADTIYVYTDFRTETDEQGNQVNIPGIKIGDGLAYLIDAPFVDGTDQKIIDHIMDSTIHVTAEDKARWDSKLSMYIDDLDRENVVFTTDIERVLGYD